MSYVDATRLGTNVVLAAVVLEGWGITQISTACTYSFHGVVADRRDGSQSGVKRDPTCANDTCSASSVVVSNENWKVIGKPMLSNGVVVDAKADLYNSVYIRTASCGYEFSAIVPIDSTFYR